MLCYVMLYNQMRRIEIEIGRRFLLFAVVGNELRWRWWTTVALIWVRLERVLCVYDDAYKCTVTFAFCLFMSCYDIRNYFQFM